MWRSQTWGVVKTTKLKPHRQSRAQPAWRSLLVMCMCVSGKGKGEQKGLNVRVRIENNGLGMWFSCVHVCGCLVTGLCQCVYITSLRGRGGGALGGGLRLPPDRGSEGSSRGGTLLRGDPAAPCGPPSRRDFWGEERKDQRRDPQRTGPPVCLPDPGPQTRQGPTQAQCVPNQEKHKQYFY